MNIKLRPWAIGDLDNLVRYANNWEIAKNLTDKFPHPYTREAGAAFIEYASKANPVHIFAIELDGEAVGGIGLHPQSDIYQKNMELGYWLAQPFWGRGVVTQAIKEIVKIGFETFDIIRIYARPFGSNIGSQRVLEKAGFVLEARLNGVFFKKDHYEDELIYAVRKLDY